jgi:hypothetical protein
MGGAGITDLTLALVLNSGGFPYTVYEAEKFRTTYKRCRPVNTHYEQSERLLQALGLFNTFGGKFVSPGCEVNCFGDQNYHSAFIP